MILADENINFLIIKALREAGVEVYSIAEQHKGFTDLQVIELAQKLKKIILTEDKDFGEWVFAHKVKIISVIFLRYTVQETTLLIEVLLKLLDDKNESLFEKFTTVTVQKIRIRNLL